jgi:GH35 family endo-1,4-beta-xylanase
MEPKPRDFRKRPDFNTQPPDFDPSNRRVNNKALLGLGLTTFSLITACSQEQTPIPQSSPTPTFSSTETPIPTSTLTPTAKPTETPTPIATLPPEQVANIEGIPDPRVTNPELFDLKNPTSPIPQFVNAMKMVSIEVNPKEVVNNLEFRQIEGKDEKNYILASYTTTDSQNTPYTVAFIAEKQENGWGWKNASTRIFADILQFPFGGIIESRQNQLNKYPNLFNAASLRYDLEWINIEPTQGKIIFTNPESYAFADRKYNFALKNKMNTIMIGLFYPPTYPDWLKNGSFKKDELIQLAKKHVYDVLSHYNWERDGVNLLIDLATEYYPTSWNIRRDVLKEGIGFEEFIVLAAQEVQKLTPNATIIIADDHNEVIGTPNYYNTSNLIRLLQRAEINNLAVGMEMHINGANPPTKEQVINAIRSYGVPVIITEMDVNIKDLNELDRFAIQAKIYMDMVDACFEAGLCAGFFLFQIGDQYSWLENGGYMGSPNSDPTILDDNLNPKPAYYAIIESFLKRLRYSNSN